MPVIIAIIITKRISKIQNESLSHLPSIEEVGTSLHARMYGSPSFLACVQNGTQMREAMIPLQIIYRNG